MTGLVSVSQKFVPYVVVVKIFFLLEVEHLSVSKFIERSLWNQLFLIARNKLPLTESVRTL